MLKKTCLAHPPPPHQQHQQHLLLPIQIHAPRKAPKEGMQLQTQKMAKKGKEVRMKLSTPLTEE